MLKPGAWEFVVGGCAVMLFGLGIYLGALITDRRHESNKQTAIKNAIAMFEPSPLNCQEKDMIRGIKELAENGAHLRYYDAIIHWSNQEEQ